MNVSELKTLLAAENLTPSLSLEREVTSGYVCDMLSWVMAHGVPGMAWTTVQTHMNVIAVAVLADMACVVLPENIKMEKENLEKAAAEGLPVLSTSLSAYEVCGKMSAAGITGES